MSYAEFESGIILPLTVPSKLILPINASTSVMLSSATKLPLNAEALITP